MNSDIKLAAEAIKNHQHNVFLVSDNVYDSIPIGQQTFVDFTDFLIATTQKKFPQCLRYDIFSGTRLVRGDESAVSREMGLIQQTANRDPNADLINALKRAKSANNSPFPANPMEAFSCFDSLLNKTQKPTIIIIERADSLITSQSQLTNNMSERVLAVAVTEWARSNKIRESGHLIFLIARQAENLSTEVVDRAFHVGQFRLAKPSEEERFSFLDGQGVEKSLLTVTAKASAGLSLNELAKVANDIKKSGSIITQEESLGMVFTSKLKVFRDEYGDVLESLATEHGFETIGGLSKPIAKLKKIVSAIKKGQISLVPQGILFLGPPGTGKTILAEAFAKESGLNFVKPKDIKNMWLGESERRMSRFINALKDLAPVVVFIDELDQDQSQRGGFEGDSGVSRNLFKKKLEVLSDTSLRGKILWIFASNRPDLIDPAMKRAGRCDLRIAFLSPDQEQAALVFQSAFKQFPDMKHLIKDWGEFAKLCDGYNGADLIGVARWAWEHVNEDGREEITEQDMLWACQDYQPQIADQEMIARMNLMALIECSSKSLRPDNWRAIVTKFFPNDCQAIIASLDRDNKPSKKNMVATSRPSLNPEILKMLNPN